MAALALVLTPEGGVGFLRDLAVVLCVAAVTTVLFQRLRQPVVLGYLLAGVIVGPHLTPQLVGESENVPDLSSLGVILVMFSLGLEFNVRRLVRLGTSAGLVCAVETGAMIWLGFSAARLLGWGLVECLFAGSMLAISSTMIVRKVFEEEPVPARTRTLAFGVLVFEDLVAILLLALLTAIASSPDGFSLGDFARESLRLGGFLAALLAAGLLLVPRALRSIVALHRDETTLIACVGLCFAMALLAWSAGYSVVLGAFLAGSLAAESGHARHLERLVQPLRDVFAAVFFVSVGMQIDPSVLVHEAGPVFLFTVLVVLGKTLGVSIGGFLAGAGVRTSVQAGLSLAQIGEFGFIIAGLGVTLGASDGRLPAIAVAVASLTAFLTPLLVRASGPFSAWVEGHLPKPLQTVAGLWDGWTERLSEARRITRRDAAARSPVGRLVGILALDALVLLAVLAAGSVARVELVGWLAARTGLGAPSLLLVLAVVALAAAPFAIGIVRVVRKLGALLGHQALPAPAEAGFDPGGAPRRVLIASVQLALLLVVGLPLAAIVQPMWPEVPLVPLFLLSMVPAGIGFWRRANDLVGHVRAGAQIVVEALARESASPESHALDQAQALLPGLGDLESLRLTPDCPAVGRTLAELDLRGSSGATVLAVQRADESIAFPDGALTLHAGDVLALSGSRGALELAHNLLAGTAVPRRVRPAAAPSGEAR